MAISIQVLDRAVGLMDAIARSKAPASLKLLALETGLHPSTAFRILSSLTEHQLVFKTDRGDYQLGSKLSHYAQRLQHDRDIKRLAQPVMRQLGEVLKQPIYLSVRHGDELLFIDNTHPGSLNHESTIGQRLPLHLTSVGKLLLAEVNDAELDAYIHRTGLPPMTEYSPAEGETLRRQLQQLHRQPMAIQREEVALGSACIGSLIRDEQQNALAGLSLVCQLPQLKEQWGEQLSHGARQISEQWTSLKKANSR